MPYADLPGIHLWYTDSAGPGVAVVFLHPATGSSASWLQQLPDFVGSGYRCIAYDRRGWGRSEPDPTGEQPGYGADDLQNLVGHLALDRFHLVGTAAGAAVALDFALSNRARTRSLVLADGTAGLADADYTAAVERIHPPEYRALPSVLREVGASYRALNPEGTQQWIEIEQRSHHRGALRQARRHTVTSERLQAFHLPTLVLGGEADLSTPPALMRMLAARIPGAEYTTLREAGHAAFWEQPAAWNARVLEFLTRQNL